jgi:hypothetical protein
MSQLNLYPNASTIDAVNDELVIWTNSLSAVQNINRNTFLNLSSQPVGLSDSQTLTNKTLTSPTISSPTLSGTLTGTYTIGGTPTFPSSITQNTVSQTLTNKTLTSPTINSPTITNATISADTLTGYTVSNTGTIYGIPVTTGTISGTYLTSGTVTSTQIATNGVSAANLATSAITLGYAQITSNSAPTSSTTAVQVTGLSVTVTIPAGGRKIKITGYTPALSNSSAAVNILTIWDGTVAIGTQIGQSNSGAGSATGSNTNCICIAVVTPSSGSKTYNIGYATTAGSTILGAGSTGPAYILVEAI